MFLPVKQNPYEKQSEKLSVVETNTHINISGPSTRQNLYNVNVDNINGGRGERNGKITETPKQSKDSQIGNTKSWKNPKSAVKQPNANSIY